MAATKRRIRVLDNGEKEEFLRLARRLRDKGATDEEFMEALDISSSGQLQSLLSGGNTTPDRLEKLHRFADRILPVLLTRDAKKREEKIAAQAEKAVLAYEAPKPPVRKVVSDDPNEHPARGKISPSQHKQLKDWMTHLMSVYPAYYGTSKSPNWTNLARVLGVKHGKSARRAFEVGCSPRSYFFLKRSVNLHAGHGTAAAESFLHDAPIEEANEDSPVATEKEEQDVPVVQASALIEFLEAANIHIQRLYKAREFFDLMSGAPTIPVHLQKGARSTREAVDMAIEEFVPGFFNKQRLP